MTVLNQFSLKGKRALVTGGEGLMGKMICETIRELGGIPHSVDIQKSALHCCNIIDYHSVSLLAGQFEKADIIINNAVGNQKPVSYVFTGWEKDIAIGLTGAMNMLTAFERHLKASNGVVLNIGSDLSLIGPDQSLYEHGSMKPLSYSVVKHGMVGMTRYFASLWGGQVRVNCLCPGGVDQGQTVPRCPMGRLARLEEMKGPVAFLISEASSYLTGSILSVDGGRTSC